MVLNIEIIRKAVGGDYEAIQRILSHYDDYITALSYVTIQNEKGIPVRYLDVEIRECIRAKLLARIIDFDLIGSLRKKPKP